jgi:hypothetical protein
MIKHSVWLRAGRPGDRASIPDRGERIFPLASVSRPALGPTQPSIQWVPVVLSSGLKHGWGVTLTTHHHLVPRSRMSRSCNSSSPRRLRGVWWNNFSFLVYLYRYSCVTASKLFIPLSYKRQFYVCLGGGSHEEDIEMNADLSKALKLRIAACAPSGHYAIL